jgi:hypothetical protein
LRQSKVKKASFSQPFVSFSNGTSSAKAAEFAIRVQAIFLKYYGLTPFLILDVYLLDLNLALDLIPKEAS